MSNNYTREENMAVSAVISSGIKSQFPDLYRDCKADFDTLFGDEDMLSDANELFVNLLYVSNFICSYKMFRYLVHTHCNTMIGMRELALECMRDPETEIVDVNIFKMCIRYCGKMTVEDMFCIIESLQRNNHKGLARTYRKRVEAMIRQKHDLA